jgi:hypothetical protein
MSQPAYPSARSPLGQAIRLAAAANLVPGLCVGIFTGESRRNMADHRHVGGERKGQEPSAGPVRR